VSAFILSLPVGYVLGSVPFGLLAARMKGVDIRRHGSGNIGATNVWRVCGWRYGLPVFLLDLLKGVAAVLLASWAAGRMAANPEWTRIGAGMACILGHSFPIWLRFKGGKGVATSLGVLAGLMPLVSLAVLLVWAVVFKAGGYVSLASIVAALALPLFAAGAQLAGRGYGWPCVGFGAFAAVLVVVRHRSNIGRLMAGTESSFRKEKS
jgi:glycerol-3-phosphate acyltransferase PlsY